MKNSLKFRKPVLQLAACLLIFVSCSTEEVENYEIETSLEHNVENRAESESVVSRNGDNELEIFNIEPRSAEYDEQLEVLQKEGVRVNGKENAIKVVDRKRNATYYFKSNSKKTYGVVYAEGELVGVISVEEGVNADGKPSLVLSNLKGDRTVDLRDAKSIDQAFSGEGRSEYSDCVSDSVEWAYDGCGGGFFGYVCAVPWSMGTVVYCVGEVAVCYFFCD